MVLGKQVSKDNDWSEHIYIQYVVTVMMIMISIVCIGMIYRVALPFGYLELRAEEH